MKWLIEFDIVGFYDNIDHEILLNLLRKRIDDERLIRLIGRMLKAGYLEDWTFHRTYSGAPQGGVVSPILANIYLHELDKVMMEMKSRFDKGQARRPSAVHVQVSKKIRLLREKIDRRRAKGKEDEVPALIDEIREWERRRRETPALDPFDSDYRRFRYCRYADDFVIGIIGSKEEARNLMIDVSQWLTDNLKLQVSAEKSGIVKANEGAIFLGYKLKTYSNGRDKRAVIRGRAVTRRGYRDQMQLHLPKEKLVQFAERRRLGNIHTNQGKARYELINNSDIAILAGYNALMRGVAEYYKLGTLWKRQIGRLQHLWWWSLIKTLSCKHKCSAAKTYQRLQNGDRLGIWYENRGKRCFMSAFRLKDVSPTLAPVRVDIQTQLNVYVQGRTDMIDRLRAHRCEACGASNAPMEIHHARKMSDMQGTTLWTYLKAARTRKRIVLCHDCHVAHHAGRLQARLDRVKQT